MKIHVVQRGENLWLLSQRYGISTSQIVLLNGIFNPNALVIGQTLLIPDRDREYVFQPGDQLWMVAQRYGISLQELLQANRITNPLMVSPGQVLTIPIYRVKPGDTLSMIAQRFGISVQAIMQANRIVNPASIYPGLALRIPEQPKPITEVNAFSDRFTETGAQEVRSIGRQLTYLSPFAYRIQEDGSLQSINDDVLVRAAESVQVTPIMAITNFSSTEPGSAVARTILNSTELQDKLLANCLNIMRAKRYRGINIDFENVLPGDRENYNEFLRRAVSRFHAQGYFVSTSLAPKISAEQKGTLYEAHDYPAHGQIVDFVVLMTYEWGYRLGPPQPISPINQIRAVLDYAVSVIPRNKIFMGFELYARDWVLPHVTGQQAETFSMQEAIRRAVQHGAEIHYDQKSQSPFYRYTDEQGRTHEVWFEDARSFQAKFNLVKEYNLRGISYWVLGYPFPQNWPLLQNNFIIRKL